MTTLPMQPSPRVAALLDKMRRNRGRLIFALDATGSREPTWDMATQLQAQMFEEAARIGGLDVQLFITAAATKSGNRRGSPMPHELVSRMGKIKCMAGATKIARVLRHIRTEHEREKIGAAIFIGDAVEEQPSELYDAAANLGVPIFMFQEGDGEVIYLDQRGELAGERQNSRAGVSRDRAAVRRRVRQIRCRSRKAARRIAARGRRVCGWRNYCARQSEHRQRAQTARSNEVGARSCRKESSATHA